MKRFATPVLVVLSLAAGFVLAAGSAGASGVGAHLQLSGGTVSWDFDDSMGVKNEADADVLGVGAAFAFDTNCARDELVNYRVGVGLEYSDYDFEGTDEDDATLGIFADNYIGFGILRNEKLRLWVGPEVRLGFFSGMGDGPTDGMTGFTLGVGPAAGLNLHLGGGLDLAFTAGLRYDMTSGSWEDTSGSDQDFSGTGSLFHATATLFFRSKDDVFAAK